MRKNTTSPSRTWYSRPSTRRRPAGVLRPQGLCRQVTVPRGLPGHAL